MNAELQKSLATSEQSLTQANEKVVILESEIERLSKEIEHLSSSEGDLRHELEGSQTMLSLVYKELDDMVASYDTQSKELYLAVLKLAENEKTLQSKNDVILEMESRLAGLLNDVAQHVLNRTKLEGDLAVSQDQLLSTQVSSAFRHTPHATDSIVILLRVCLRRSRRRLIRK